MQNFETGAFLYGVFGEDAAPLAGTWLAGEQAEHVAGHGVQGTTFGEAGGDVGFLVSHGAGGGDGGPFPEQRAVNVAEEAGGLVGGAAEHDAVESGEMFPALINCRNAAIEHNCQAGAGGFQLGYEAVIERRDFAVLLRAEAAQPGLAGVDGEDGAAGSGDFVDEGEEGFARGQVVDGDAVLDGDRDGDGGAHGGDAIGDKIRLGHQARAERAGLDAL